MEDVSFWKTNLVSLRQNGFVQELLGVCLLALCCHTYLTSSCNWCGQTLCQVLLVGTCFSFKLQVQMGMNSKYFFKTSRNMKAYWWPKEFFLYIYSYSAVLNDRLTGISKIIMFPYLNGNYWSVIWCIDILVDSVYMEPCDIIVEII